MTLTWRCCRCGRILFESETCDPFPAIIDKCCGFTYRIQLTAQRKADIEVVAVDKHPAL